MTDWNQEARRILRAELERKGVSYKVLARALADIGIDETEASVANKLSRGTFSFAFYLQCMKATNRATVEIRLTDIELKRPVEGTAK